MPVKHFLIKGKVQGVFFRASAKEFADRLGIAGWVRNTPEGDVEALVEGSPNQINEFAKWCKAGPDRAIVHEVLESEAGIVMNAGFIILR